MAAKEGLAARKEMGGVPYYRLYFLDRRGRFGRVEGFAAPDDAAAVEVAEGQDDAVKELWCGGRRVKQWRGASAA